MKDKYEFIVELLETNKLTPAQKERVLLLSKDEIKKGDITGKDLEERVKKLEDSIGVSPPVTIGNTEEPTKEIFPKQYYNPKDLYQFLKAYNEDEILKGTCHLVNTGELNTINRICKLEVYNFKTHYERIIKGYELLEEEFKNKFVDNKFKSLIHTYLTGGRDWNNKIKINWNSPDLKKWAEKNPGIPPNLDDDLSEEYKNIGYEFDEFTPMINLLPNNQIKTFSELTQYFKYLFHIRSDNSITKICNSINLKFEWEEKIDFDYSNINESVELFTNLEKLIEVYKELIKLILDVVKKNNLDKPKVSLWFQDFDNNVVFSIEHINTTYKHTLQDAIKRPGQIYRNLIQNQLNGLCEFNIEADFGENDFANLSIWNYNVWKSKKIDSKKINKIDGVKYILTFKK